MEQYIKKSDIVAEIEKYISNYKGILNKVDKSSDDWVESTLMLESKIDILQHILSFLDTLEVKEVDLDKEIDKVLDDDWYGEYISHAKFAKSAKHFFELGLNAQKGG